MDHRSRCPLSVINFFPPPRYGIATQKLLKRIWISKKEKAFKNGFVDFRVLFRNFVFPILVQQQQFLWFRCLIGEETPIEPGRLTSEISRVMAVIRTF
jgi:hypothetical protein